MPHLDIVDNRIYITSELSEREMIKLVPGSNWDGDRGQWHVPLAWASCVTLRGLPIRDRDGLTHRSPSSLHSKLLS
jgi:hypothetical protein